jgi:hypothetical protein
MKDNCVGPSNVPHEHLKFVKKGTKSRGIVFFLHVFSVSIIIVKNNPCMRTIHLFLFAGTLGMATKKQQRAAAKKKKNLSSYQLQLNARKWVDALLATGYLTVNQLVL